MITGPRAERLPFKGGFPVYPSRYVILGTAERRAAIRFFNAGDVGVTGVRFRFSEKDENGEVLDERVVEREGVSAEPAQEFAVADVPVSYDCASVEIAVLAVYSDAYEYVFEEDGVRLKYGHGAAEPGREVNFLPRPVYSVSGRRKKYVFISFLAVFGVAALAGVLGWRLGFFDRTERASAQPDTEIVRSIDAEIQ